jgi:predicted metal-binding membrane protein
MMVAMMVPAASPVILLFAEINRRRNEPQGTLVASGQFLLGYLTAWTAFSVLATLLQWGLLTAALVSPCLGCCWALMGLLFAFGVMNPLWVASISAFVLLEKVSPANQLVSRLSGLLFIGWAAWIVFGERATQV